MFDGAGKTVLVTGGVTGIGRAIALAFAATGARVAVTFNTHEPEEDFLRALGESGQRPLALRLDATSDEDTAAVIRRLVDELGRVDVLVNNAGGMISRTPIADMDAALWRNVIAVNLDTMFLVTHHVLPLIPDGGQIVNIASVAAQNGGSDGAVAYATAKAGMIGFTRGLSKELASRKIRVNAVAPGLILETPFHERFTAPDKQRSAIEATALKRAGVPDDVAGPVLALCSEQFGYVTGSVVDINGGQYFA